MKIKQTDERNRSKKSEKAVQGWGTRSLWWERLVKKEELRREEVMMYMNCREWIAVNVKETV